MKPHPNTQRVATAISLSLLLGACATNPGPTTDLRIDRDAATASARSRSIRAAADAAPEDNRPALEEINTEEVLERARRAYGSAEFLGEATIVSGTRFEESVVGGLSGITWAGGDQYFAISDDRGDNGPGRFYTLRIDLADGRLDSGDVELIRWTSVLGDNGEPLEPQTFDMEGIASALDGSVYISSEGEARAQIPPFVKHLLEDGSHLGWIELPDKFRPSADGARGVRPNLALESLAITPDGRYLFTATENALQQDGPQASFRHASPSRILKIDLTTGNTVGEYVYMVDPVRVGESLADIFHTTGLVDLIAFNSQHLLALERTFVAGAGFVERIHWVCLEESSNVLGLENLQTTSLSSLPTGRKKLFLDLSQLGIRLDNLEGMTLGAALPDGRRALILISDNNFNPSAQITQILAFAVPADLAPPY